MRVCAEKPTQVACVNSPGVRSRSPYRSFAYTTTERPSGVSSARLASCAASASARSSTPPIGRKSPASRLPMVMVPVLSSSSVFTSPAASTARPLIASTLRCTSRSMPAIPIADNNAPIVVGIRQTTRLTSTIPVTPLSVSAALLGTPGCCTFEKIANGCSVATASRKMIVSAASRMFSAISLGVFCRFAPSTRAIIRSMKLSPGFCVICHDDPVGEHPGAAGDRGPVTARFADDRGRLAGDGRLVDAGDAVDDIPVARDDLPGLHDDDVALPQQRRRHRFDPGGLHRIAGLPAGQAQRHRVGLGPPQRGRLRLPAAFGDGLGQVGGQNGQPQPHHDQPGEHAGVRDREHRGEHGPDLHDEHHRVAPQRARVELAQRGGQRRPQHLRVEQPGADPPLPAEGGLGRVRVRGEARQRGGAHAWIPSASGPSASAGK